MTEPLQQIKTQVVDVEYEYEELCNAPDPYSHGMALAALGLAIQELRRVVDAASWTTQ